MIGKKGKAWIKAKKYLLPRYFQEGIIRCESCGKDWALSFHHLDKRSSGRAEHTFEGTRLLCGKCHHQVHFGKDAKEFNEELKKLR